MLDLQQRHLHEILKFLQTRAYVEVKEGTYVFSPKFFLDLQYQTVTEQSEYERQLMNIPVLVPDIDARLANYHPPPFPASVLQSSTVYTKDTDWKGLFIDLILKAEVPKMSEGTRGEMYYTNKFSEAALKVFRKAIEKEGVHLPTLIQSTKLYYKSKVRLKKAVGNYFIQGDWLSDYQALADSMLEGKDSVVSHIKEQTDNGTKSQYKLG